MRHLHYLPPTILFGMVVSAALPASAYEADLQAQQSPDIAYVTGGIGDEERDELQSMRSDYNLHLMSAAGKSGEFQGDTSLAIYNRRGEQVLSTEIGPLFYARLPRGSYTLVASNDSREISRKFTVGAHPVDVGLYW